MNTKRYIPAVMALAIVASVGVAVPAFAATNSAQAGWYGGAQNGGPQHRPTGVRNNTNMMRPSVVGTVSAISGTTLTVSGRQGFGSTSATVTFTVDASNAVVMKNNATTTVSSIATGDTIAVQGTVSGTNVTATTIRDGIMMRPGGARTPRQPGQMGSSSPSIGNGQPVVAGTVSAISGSTLTITNKSNVTYTVDASSAKVLKGAPQGTTSSLSNVAVGDSVLAQGTINGTSVTASTIIDQTNSTTSTQPHQSFFGGIGSFFMHLFGF